MQTTTQEKYRNYLTTEYWQEVSRAVKARAGHRCQVCNTQFWLEAHHRTYAHRGNELEHLDDMICLCTRCHSIFHMSETASVPVAGLGMARAQLGPQAGREMARFRPNIEKEELVLITRENCRRLSSTKEPWHWMMEAGINPRKSGWMKRAVGQRVPKRFLR